MDREAWHAAIHRVAKSRTRLSNWAELNWIPYRATWVAQWIKNLPAIQETQVWSLGQEDPLEEGMAPHSSILAWRSPEREELSRLQSTGSQRVRHDWSDWACMHIAPNTEGRHLAATSPGAVWVYIHSACVCNSLWEASNLDVSLVEVPGVLRGNKKLNQLLFRCLQTPWA